MAGKIIPAGVLAVLIAVVGATGIVFAHGDDNDYAQRGYGMGPGMMGGHDMGRGMMGGYGMGPGMMGGGLGLGLELKSDQRERIIDIQSELRKQHWALHGQMMEAQDQLSKLYAKETPDPKKIGAVYGKIFDLRRQVIEATIEARNRQQAVLTPEQRKQVQGNAYWPNRGYYGPGPGTMHHGFGHHMMGG